MDQLLLAVAVFVGTTLLGMAASVIGVNLFFDKLSMPQVLGIFYPTVMGGAALAGLVNHAVLKRRVSFKVIAGMNLLHHLAAAFLAWGFIMLGMATGSAGAEKLVHPYIDIAPLLMAGLSWTAVTTWAPRAC